jgi:hypothetical protein
MLAVPVGENLPGMEYGGRCGFPKFNGCKDRTDTLSTFLDRTPARRA